MVILVQVLQFQEQVYQQLHLLVVVTEEKDWMLLVLMLEVVEDLVEEVVVEVEELVVQETHLTHHQVKEVMVEHLWYQILLLKVLVEVVVVLEVLEVMVHKVLL
jgi:hypothetical protein